MDSEELESFDGDMRADLTTDGSSSSSSSSSVSELFNATEDEWSSSSTTTTTTTTTSMSSVATNRIVTLAVIMLVALVGNCIIVISLTCTRYRVLVGGQTSSRVSIFILNLAISDLAVCLITIPGEMIVTAYEEWVLGATACKLVVFAQIIALAGTIFNLSAMSYDRYLAICQPLRFRNSVSRAQRTIAVAWLLAVVLSVPQLFIFVRVQRGRHADGAPIYDCASQGYTAWWQRRVYFSCLTVCVLVVPAALITFCYTSIVRVVWRQGNMQTVVEMRRSGSVSTTTSVLSLRKCVNDDKFLSRAKVRTIKLTLCIILTFVACWTPYFVVNNIRIHSHYQTKIPASVRAFAETLALVNSALNPLIYMCFNLNAKKALHDVCFCCCGCCFDGEAAAAAAAAAAEQRGHRRRRHRGHLQHHGGSDVDRHVDSRMRSILRKAVVNFNRSGGGGGGFSNNATPPTPFQPTSEYNSVSGMDDTVIGDYSPSNSVKTTTSRAGSTRYLVHENTSAVDGRSTAGRRSSVGHLLLQSDSDGKDLVVHENLHIELKNVATRRLSRS